MALHLLAYLVIIFTCPAIPADAQGGASISVICRQSQVYDFCMDTFKEILPTPYGATIIDLNKAIIQKSYDNSTNTQLYIVDLLGQVTDEEQKQALSVCVESFTQIITCYHGSLGYLETGDRTAVLYKAQEASAAQSKCTASFDLGLSLRNEQMKKLDAISLAAAKVLLQPTRLRGRFW